MLSLAANVAHQRQPTDKSCLATCVAMAVGVPVDALGLPVNRPLNLEDVGPWLAERGVWLRLCGRHETFRDGLYLVGVLSLNDMHELHSVLVDCRGGAFNLYDPNAGNEGKRAYTILNKDDIYDISELVAASVAPIVHADANGIESEHMQTTAAGILLVTPRKRALFIKRSEACTFPGMWCFPGGRMDDGETPEECAVRECREEIGIAPEGTRTYWTQTSRAGDGVEGVSAGSFITYLQTVPEEFAPVLNDESVGWAWAPIDAPPEPLHPGCRIALDRFGMNELDIARAMSEGRLASPQFYENMWLFDIRITGTGAAFRKSWDEYVWRAPEIYMNDEFLARCNGLAVIWEHPPKATLDSGEFSKRVIGSVFLPYLKPDVQEVWAIVKVYDEWAAKMMRDETLSTSPSVMFRPSDAGTKLMTDDGRKILIETDPALLDHIAICGFDKDGNPIPGVWDKAGPLTGVNAEARADADIPAAKIDAALLAAGMIAAENKFARIRDTLR